VQSKLARSWSHGHHNDGRSIDQNSRPIREPGRLSADRQYLCRFYLLDQVEAKFDAIKRASNWLNDQLGDLRDKVRDSERAVELFKEQNNLSETKGLR